MKTRWALLVATGTAMVATQVVADTVCEWIDFAQGIQAAATPPAGAARTPAHEHAQTQVALAMFEALNAIDRRYESLLGLPLFERSASQDAAAATAAHAVLVAHYPSQMTPLGESYAIALESVADPRARAGGIAIGRAAAELALQAGGIDPSIQQVPYVPRTQAGVWVPTQLPLVAPFNLALKPWILERADSVRPGPPPAFDSATWVRDYNEVKRLGAKDSRERTPHETLMARYRISPNLMPAYRLVADAPGRKPVQNARMFAMVSMISDDTALAISDAKMHYGYWRPITAIRNGELDGNPATQPAPGWEPLISTPNHPEYPCGHCITAAAIAEYMKTESDNAPPAGVRVSSRSIPISAIQALPSWDEWARQVSYSRTLGGVHYRFSNEVAEEMGRKVTRMATTRILRPLPKAEQRPAP